MQWRGPFTAENRVGANDYRVKMVSKTKNYHVNMLKKYISREPDAERNVVLADDTDGATIAVAGVIHQVEPELGEVPDLEGYRQREGVHNVKLGDELPEDQRCLLKDLVQRFPMCLPKKYGSNRVCVDFRKLNKITEVDPKTMTTAEDLMRRLSGKKYLSKIDLTKGYWQIPVAPEDEHKTAFVTPDGQYEFTIRDYSIRD